MGFNRNGVPKVTVYHFLGFIRSSKTDILFTCLVSPYYFFASLLLCNDFHNDTIRMLIPDLISICIVLKGWSFWRAFRLTFAIWIQ